MKLTINGEARDLDVPEDTPLLWVLRDELGLTGTKFGCGVGSCGACTVHVDGSPVFACTLPVAAVAGQSVTTIEGVGGKPAEQVLAAWQEMDVAQCGYCQPGQIMAATALLAGNPEPSDADIDAAMAGNVCRCATYQRIRGAIHLAATKMRA